PTLLELVTDVDDRLVSLDQERQIYRRRVDDHVGWYGGQRRLEVGYLRRAVAHGRDFVLQVRELAEGCRQRVGQVRARVDNLRRAEPFRRERSCAGGHSAVGQRRSISD